MLLHFLLPFALSAVEREGFCGSHLLHGNCVTRYKAKATLPFPAYNYRTIPVVLAPRMHSS